jgi:hypothetical protein
MRESLTLLGLVGMLAASVGAVSAADQIVAADSRLTSSRITASVAELGLKNDSKYVSPTSNSLRAGPLVFDGGTPDGADGRNIAAFGTVDNFSLASNETLDGARIWILPAATFNGILDVTIYENNGGAVGAVVATATTTVEEYIPTGNFPFGIQEHSLTVTFDAPISLPAGEYWFQPRANGNCPQESIFWSSTSPGFAPDALQSAALQCGGGFFPFASPSPNCAFQLFGACEPDVLVLQLNSGCGSTVTDFLSASGKFGAVDLHSAGSSLPSLSTLLNYDVVLYYSSGQQPSSATGDLLADYFDAGGGVVDCTSSVGVNLGGRWVSGGYAPMSLPGLDCNSKSLGTIPNPSHPIMDGVTAIDFQCSGGLPNTLDPGADVIAFMSNGGIAAATKLVSGRPIVSIGYYPSPQPCSTSFTLATDGDEMIVNAALFAADCSGGGGPIDPCLEDTVDPIILDCPGDFTTPCNTAAGYNLDYTPLVDDECDTTFTVDPDGTLPYGTTLVTVTVTDQSGNDATCSFNVTVTPDIQEPLRTASIGAEDGYVREPNLITMAEGPAVTKGTTAQVGDDSANWQNRGVFSFDTSDLPDDAVVTTVTLRLTRASSAGNTASLGNLVLDMGGSLIGSTQALDTFDYDDSAAASLNVATSFPVPAGNGFTTFATVDSAYNGQVDVTGRTQFRVRFDTLTDSDNQSDYIAFHTGEAASNVRPELIVEYYTPSCFEYPVLEAPCDGPFEVTLWSTPAEDGGVGESHYTSEVGGSIRRRLRHVSGWRHRFAHAAEDVPQLRHVWHSRRRDDHIGGTAPVSFQRDRRSGGIAGRARGGHAQPVPLGDERQLRIIGCT